MEYKSFKPAVFTTLLFVCLELSVATDRRYINQLNSFKREIREELSFMRTDIDKLFKSQEEIQTALRANKQTKFQYQKSDDSMDSKERPFRNCSGTKETNKMSEDCGWTYVGLLNAFESEKRLSRKLQTRLQVVENVVSKMTKNIDICQGFMGYINDTLKEMKDALSTVKYSEQIAKGSVNGKNEMVTTSTIAKSSTTARATTSTMAKSSTIVRATTSPIAKSSTAVRATTSIIAKSSTTVRATTSTVAGTTQRFCKDINGVYGIYLEPLRIEKSIYCDADTDGGDWIVIMRRQDGSVNFDREWKDYKIGFGNVDGEFWIGNGVLHELTKNKPMELRIDMEDYAGSKAFAKYKVFQVGPEAEKYVLTVTGYSGTAGDSLDKLEPSGGIHNGQTFSTTDSDNDKYDRSSCARSYPGGWWFNFCFRSHLTGIYGKTTKRSYQGIIWHSWLGSSDYLKYVDMKIR